MRITRIDLPAFGCLQDFATELSPGLNVFHGDNEAGKSTLQAAISALLYGFFENERSLKHETERYERFRPWNGQAYRGSLEYELTTGERYEVRRNFADDVATQVIDATTGLDIAPQFGRGRHGNVPFARRHLGMSRAVFQSCAFISQGEIFEVTHGASPSQIGDAVAALADSARRDVSAARAIERIDAAISRIGTDRARTAELPCARERLRRAREEIRSAEAAREQVAATVEALRDCRRRVSSLKESLATKQVLALKAQTAGVRKRFDAVVSAEQEWMQTQAEAERLSEAADFPSLLRDEVLALKERWQQLRTTVARLAREDDEARAAISEDERLEYAAIREDAASLSDEQVWTLQAAAFAPVPTGGILRAVGRAVRAAARAVIRLALRLLRRPLPESDEPAALAISAAEALRLLERHRRYLTLRPKIEAAQKLSNELLAQTQALESAEAQLRTTLESAGVTTPDMPQALAAFDARWRGQQAYRQAALAAEEARKRLEVALGGRTCDDFEERLASCERSLADALAKRPELAGEESTAGFEELVEERDRLREELERAQIEESGLDKEVRLMLEGQRPAAELEEEAARWEREAERLEAARAALEIARAQIQEAMVRVYRDFAPAVNTFLSEGIEHVTEGRYQRAHVDPSTLKVSLLVPETGQVITDPPVSRGTRTVVYVLMRIGLAQHMSTIGEPVPLVLDDPFVDVDARRLERMLDFLLGLSSRMQVLLFTKEDAVKRWFEERARSGEHSLHALTETELIPSLL